MSEELSITIDDLGVARVYINRPDKHNAFNDHLIAQLTHQFLRLDSDPSVRVMVLSGQGTAFSSGADLTWMKSMIDYDQEENRRDAVKLAELMQALYNMSKPTIARVNGVAFGGAIGLIACCDAAIAIENSKFCFSEVKLGIAPAVISPYIISAIGARHAKKLFLTGEIFDTEKAVQIGLVHSSSTLDNLDKMVNEQVSHFLLGGQRAQYEIKQLVHSFTNIDEDTKWKTAEIISKLRVSDEGQEGINAFLQKRKPNWLA